MEAPNQPAARYEVVDVQTACCHAQRTQYSVRPQQEPPVLHSAERGNGERKTAYAQQRFFLKPYRTSSQNVHERTKRHRGVGARLNEETAPPAQRRYPGMQQANAN
jgi:hypothetical protein